MIKKISTSFIHKYRINFLVDDDAEMDYLSLADFKNFDRFFVVIDKKVKVLWGDLIFQKLKAHGKEIFIFEVKVNEDKKSLRYYPTVVDFLEKKKCGLSDLVIAVGGGIVIDLVSFVCSTYMRSLQFVAVPTTIIGQIDASTAGKTCLNSFTTKNVLGTFYYPLEVYNNIHFLKTNSAYYNRQGLSEAFKYGLLGSKKLISLLKKFKETGKQEILISLILEAIRVRLKIRKRNPLASNLGHTFGQAMERASNYKILHGDAISAGLVMSLFFSFRHGLIRYEVIEKIMEMMKNFGLNLFIDKKINVDGVVENMGRDKKSSSKFINLVLLSDIAKPYRSNDSYFFKTTPLEVKSFLKGFISGYKFVMTDCAAKIKGQLNYNNIKNV